MKAYGMRSGLAALVSLLTTSCSLVGLDDFKLPECTQADCDLLGNRSGDLLLCRSYLCETAGENAGRCVPADGEVCDGYDNDCDGLVDEPADASPTFTPTSEAVLDDVPAVEVGYGQSPEGTPAVTWVTGVRSPDAIPRGDGNAFLAVLGETVLRGELEHRRNPDFSLRDVRVDATQCWAINPADPSGYTSRPCDFSEVSVDVAQTAILTASVSAVGCTAGQLHIGFSDRAVADPVSIVRGPPRRSNSFAGIDPTADGACSGGHRPDCADAVQRKLDLDVDSNLCTSDPECPDLSICSAARCEVDGELTETPCSDMVPCATGECQPLGRCVDDADGSVVAGQTCGGGTVCMPTRVGQTLTCTNTCQLDDAGHDALDQAVKDIRLSCGVSRPRIAALGLGPGEPTQGLAVWLGGSHEVAPAGASDDTPVLRSRCGGRAIPVEMAAVYLQQITLQGTQRWVTTSNEGIPQTLGQTLGSGRPAVAALGTRGFYVGHGDEEGALALHFIPQSEDPPVTSTANPDPLDGDPEDRTGLEVPEVAVETFPTLPPGFGGPVDRVAIAPGAIRADGIDLGVAWQEGCGADELIAFRLVRVGSDGSGGISNMGTAIRISDTTAESVGPPTVMYLTSGFLVPTVTTDDGRMAGTNTQGGFWVVWTEATGSETRVFGRRVSELDGQLVDELERVELTRGVSGARASAPYLVPSESGGQPGFLFHESSTDTVRSGVMCAAEPAPPPDEG